MGSCVVNGCLPSCAFCAPPSSVVPLCEYLFSCHMLPPLFHALQACQVHERQEALAAGRAQHLPGLEGCGQRGMETNGVVPEQHMLHACWPWRPAVAALHARCTCHKYRASPSRLAVNVLTIFVESNQGDEDTTIIQKLAVFGSSAFVHAPTAVHAACNYVVRFAPHPRMWCLCVQPADPAHRPPACCLPAAAGDSFNVAEIKDISKEDK